MSNHGAEANLPISELAQWMRDTTGRPDDGSGPGLREVYRYEVERDYSLRITPDVVTTRISDKTPGTLTVNDVIQVAEIDKPRLMRAALEAIEVHKREKSPTVEEGRIYADRIWALHDQILEEAG